LKVVALEILLPLLQTDSIAFVHVDLLKDGVGLVDRNARVNVLEEEEEAVPVEIVPFAGTEHLLEVKVLVLDVALHVGQDLLRLRSQLYLRGQKRSGLARE